MKRSSPADVYVALIHYPVVNKNGETIASAVTNLDLHDIARTAKTYGLGAFYVVTPLVDQQAMVKRIVSHWSGGVAAYKNPARKRALELVRIMDSVAAAKADIRRNTDGNLTTVITSARRKPGALGFEDMRSRLGQNGAFLFLFGTAWGLAEDLIHSADVVLDPVRGGTGYNHLSVRSAVAIVFDRLLGENR